MKIFVFYTISMILIILLKNINSSDVKQRINSVRKNPAENILKNNNLISSLTNVLEGNTEYSKKYDLETLALQAGYTLTYGEIKLFSIFLAILFPLLSITLVKNNYLALLLLLVGYKTPITLLKSMRDKRKKLSEKQIGSFIDMLTERQLTHSDLNQNILDLLESFKGQEPFYSELLKSSIDITSAKLPPKDVISRLARRTGDQYLIIFRDSYELSKKMTSTESKENILRQAKEMYETDFKLKDELSEKINGPVSTVYLVLACVPGAMVYQAFVNKNYINFLINKSFGKIGLASTVAVVLLTMWIVNVKIKAPLD